MTTFIIRRLITSVIVLVLVTLAVFLAVRLLPGDPILIYYTSGQLTELSQEQIDAARHDFGLDRPIYEQYTSWFGNALKGDLGKSIAMGSPVTELIKQKLPITLHLSLIAFFISAILGIILGVIAAVRWGTWIDTVATTLANIGITIPVFWLGIALIYIFALYLGWLPVQGYTSPFVDFGLSTRQLIMPVFCLTIFPIAAIARQTRSCMLEVMRQDYIRTAWSKGLAERNVIMKHALKNGMIPVVTLLGLIFNTVIGGSVFVETVFNIPGIGRLAVSSVLGQDYTVVQGIVLITAAFVLIVNLIVEISYGWLDPKIRYA
ncbi:MAG: ABC transporter permease [Dehalococcoidales bacterium]|nr:ABC transporter permease [Dehalococcoidales bacterium]